MGVDAFVKFCKIGALSATGTRPFDAGADGFVMGEGAALFVLKRLEDAERDGDRVYAVILGIGGSSDGKGKGITAPNPVGQRLAVERAWASAGRRPRDRSAVEAHGTSTRVGDAVELASLADVFGAAGAAPGSIALGSVKSNIGHLKAAAGAAGLFKMVMRAPRQAAAAQPELPRAQPEHRLGRACRSASTPGCAPWDAARDGVRRGRRQRLRLRRHQLPRRRSRSTSPAGTARRSRAASRRPRCPGRRRPPPRAGARHRLRDAAAKAPLRGALVLGGRDDADVVAQLAGGGLAEAARRPDARRHRPRPGARLRGRAGRHRLRRRRGPRGQGRPRRVKAFALGQPGRVWKLLRAQGVFVGRGPAPKVAFLYTGQGSQYVNMLKTLRGRGADGRRHLRRGRPGDDAAARAPAHRRTSSSTATTRPRSRRSSSS